MTTSTPSSAIHFFTTARIASTSSVTMSRAASLWPAAVSRSASVLPDLSSESDRVSEIVSTAMLSEMNCFDSSIEDIANPCPVIPGRAKRELRRAVAHLRISRFRVRLFEAPRNDNQWLQRPVAKRIAGLHGALLVAVHEPLLALRRGAVGEGVRHHTARGLALQRVVADGRRRRQ